MDIERRPTDLSESVAKDVEEKNKTEEEKHSDGARLKEEKRRTGPAWEEMWTTPGLSPLAEPPMLN